MQLRIQSEVKHQVHVFYTMFLYVQLRILHEIQIQVPF